METTEDQVKAYIARCQCGGIIFACADDPKYAEDTARSVAEVIKDGFSVERVPLDTARNSKWCDNVRAHRKERERV